MSSDEVHMLPAHLQPVDPYCSFKSEPLRLVALVCRDSPQVAVQLLNVAHAFARFFLIVLLWLMT